MTNTPSDAELEKLAAEHLKAFAQFTGAGDVWVEGEVAFARAVLAKWGTPQPVVREPLTQEQVSEIADAAHRECDRLVSSDQCAPRWSAVFAYLLERAHGIKGGQHGTDT